MKIRIILTTLLFLQVFTLQSQTPVRPLFDIKTIGDIKINLSDSRWWETLDSLRIYGKETLEGTITIDGQVYRQSGLRFRGNSSYQYGMKRNPFHLKLDKVNKDQNHQGHRTIKLSSALRDPSMVREALFLEIASKYVPAPAAAYTRLYVNDEYQGIYLLIESVDTAFLFRNYGANRMPRLYKAGVDHPKKNEMKGCLEQTGGSLQLEANADCLQKSFEIETDDTDYKPLFQLTQALHGDIKNLKNILDVDQTLWMLALNNVMVNLSSYLGKPTDNFYLYQDGFGKFHPIFWDLNLAFGSYKNTGVGSDLELKDLQRLEPLLHNNNPAKPLVSKLLSDPLYKKMYLSHIRQILEDHFLNGWYERRARELQGLIVIPFSEDNNKPYTLDQFQNSLNTTIGRKTKIPGIVELMSKRMKFLKNHPELSALPSTVSDIQFARRDKYASEQVRSFTISLKADKYAKRAILFFRFDERDEFKQLSLTEGAQQPNQTSGVRFFEGAVESPTDQAVMEYYILVENPGMVSFSPQNYTTKKHKISMGDINK